MNSHNGDMPINVYMRAVGELRSAVEKAGGPRQFCIANKFSYGRREADYKGPANVVKAVIENPGKMARTRVELMIKLQRKNKNIFSEDLWSKFKACESFMRDERMLKPKNEGRGIQEACTFVASLFGYDNTGDFPVPTMTAECGRVALARIADILDIDHDEIVEKMCAANRQRRAAMSGVADADGMEWVGAGEMVEAGS